MQPGSATDAGRGSTNTWTDDGTRRRDIVLGVLVLAIVGGVVPVLLAHHFGALGIPRNDDWAWISSAFELFDHSRIDGQNWAPMNLVGQLLAAWPVMLVFGRHIEALQIETAVFGVIGLVAVLDLGTRLLPVRRAVYVALVVAVGPMWASLAASFMTDVPAFALAMVCLALGARGVGPDRLRWPYWPSLVIGFAAFTIREYALVAVFAVALTGVWSSWWRPAARTRALIAFFALVASAVVFTAWHAHLPHWAPIAVGLPDPSSVREAIRSLPADLLAIGLLTLPAVVLAGPVRIVRNARSHAPRTTMVVSAALALLVGRHLFVHRGLMLFFGTNYLVPSGSVQIGHGVHPPLLPRALWFVITVSAACSAVVVACSVIAGVAAVLHRPSIVTLAPPTLLIVALAAAGYGVSWAAGPAIGASTYDRYALPLVPLVMIGVLRGAPTAPQHRLHQRAVAGGAAFTLLAALGVMYGVNTASYNGTVWRVDRSAAETAGATTLVDGGFEWNHWHHVHLPDTCITVRRQEREPTDRSALVASASVTSGLDTQLWIVARQVRPC